MPRHSLPVKTRYGTYLLDTPHRVVAHVDGRAFLDDDTAAELEASNRRECTRTAEHDGDDSADESD